ncbi:Neuropilin-1a [Ilyodon furcidens]|uniref:Neuropilin-1a n=3 Tax=Goodeidae TaxID=28758 RepID=A0ABU7EI09_9TELE|nr:Neuropilin-1a [Characodon lateralis]
MRCGFLLFLFTQIISVSPLTQTDKCGGNIVIHAADYLTSPGYPSAYPPSQLCVWVITAPEAGQKILINFNPHFDLEDRDCKGKLCPLLVKRSGLREVDEMFQGEGDFRGNGV